MQFSTTQQTHVFVLLSLCPLSRVQSSGTDSKFYVDLRGNDDGSNVSQRPELPRNSTTAATQQQQHPIQLPFRFDVPSPIVR